MFLATDAWRDGGDGRLEPTAAERDWIWCLRRVALARPLGSARDAGVHAVLQRRFGGRGLGLEHLQRCLVVGLARRAVRSITLHAPCHPALTSDETRLLLALRASRQPATAAALLAPIAGERSAELVPLLAATAALLAG
jgi:hypothetical protein